MLTEILEWFIAAAADDYVRRAIDQASKAGQSPDRVALRAAMTVTYAAHSAEAARGYWDRARRGWAGASC